jgi:hypothetical protein
MSSSLIQIWVIWCQEHGHTDQIWKKHIVIVLEATVLVQISLVFSCFLVKIRILDIYGQKRGQTAKICENIFYILKDMFILEISQNCSFDEF